MTIPFKGLCRTPWSRCTTGSFLLLSSSSSFFFLPSSPSFFFLSILFTHCSFNGHLSCVFVNCAAINTVLQDVFSYADTRNVNVDVPTYILTTRLSDVPPCSFLSEQRFISIYLKYCYASESNQDFFISLTEKYQCEKPMWGHMPTKGWTQKHEGKSKVFSHTRLRSGEHLL